MKKYLKDNRGVSLIELIVVLAIMMVLASLTTFSVRMLSSRSATQCAENMKISLEKNRTTVMGKKNGRIAFFRDADGNVCMQEEFNYSADVAFKPNSSSTRIGKREVEVYCNGTALTTSPVIIEFSRSGSIKSGAENLPIVIKKQSKEYEIIIDSITGKIEMKRK